MKFWAIYKVFVGLGLVFLAALLAPAAQGIVLPSSTVAVVENGFWRNVINQFIPSGAARSMEMVHVAPTGFDFWTEALKLGDKLRHFTEAQLKKVSANAGVASEKLHEFTQSIETLLEAARHFRSDVEASLSNHGLSPEVFSQLLENEMEQVMHDLKSTFPPPAGAPGHDERSVMITLTLSKAEDRIVNILASRGIQEEDARGKFANVKYHMARVLTHIGDLIEQHPVLLSTLLIGATALVLPEISILSPLLRLFGFGPAGPMKNSFASWAQRRFWGGAVAEGSWFAYLQSAGMIIGNGKKVLIPIGIGASIIGSFSFCR